MTTKRQKHLKQLEELFLKDSDGNQLEFCSELTQEENGLTSFWVGNSKTGQKFKISFKAEEIDG